MSGRHDSMFLQMKYQAYIIQLRLENVITQPSREYPTSEMIINFAINSEANL